MIVARHIKFKCWYFTVT